MPNFLVTGQAVAEMWSVILEFVLHISHKEHLMVFIIVRNITGINEVLSIICRFLYLASLA